MAEKPHNVVSMTLFRGAGNILAKQAGKETKWRDPVERYWDRQIAEHESGFKRVLDSASVEDIRERRLRLDDLQLKSLGNLQKEMEAGLPELKKRAPQLKPSGPVFKPTEKQLERIERLHQMLLTMQENELALRAQEQPAPQPKPEKQRIFHPKPMFGG